LRLFSRYLQVDKQKDYHGTTELKLGGCPWWADGNDAVESRYFISSLIGALKANGWEVKGTIDLSRHNNDKSTFLLKQCGAQVSKLAFYLVCILSFGIIIFLL